MKSLIATALVALGLLSTAVAAQASPYDGYPDWAQRAFENYSG
jgi:opacity protein-like surface antigen